MIYNIPADARIIYPSTFAASNMRNKNFCPFLQDEEEYAKTYANYYVCYCLNL